MTTTTTMKKKKMKMKMNKMMRWSVVARDTIRWRT